jgi:type I restriction enzyme, R subunit
VRCANGARVVRSRTASSRTPGNDDGVNSESERTTRRSRIDPKLKVAGWEVVPTTALSSSTGDRVAVEEFETAIGPADYALFDGGRCLGVAEAKKLTPR